MALGTRILTSLRRVRSRLLNRQEDAHLRDLADFLGDVPLFAPLTRGMRFELAEALHERRFKRDEFLYLQGDPGIGAYILREGSIIRIVRGADDSLSEAGKAVVGDIIGSDSLVGGGYINRPESAQATTDCTVLGLFGPELHTVERRHPRTGAAVFSLLARHLALCLAELRDDLAQQSTAADAVAMIDSASDRATARLSTSSDIRPA